MTRDPKELSELEAIDLLDEESEEELVRALRSAWTPGDIDPAVNEALIAAALEDPLAPPTDEELVESERLRQALEGEGDHPDARLARALRVAAAPPPIAELTSERIVRSAIGPKRGSERSRRGTVLVVSFGAASALLAIAASWFVFERPAIDQGTEYAKRAVPLSELAVSRSTSAMFHEKFETTGTTDRVDRIALERSRELRSNRYALWGVR
jgi:hypothetical protein